MVITSDYPIRHCPHCGRVMVWIGIKGIDKEPKLQCPVCDMPKKENT